MDQPEFILAMAQELGLSELCKEAPEAVIKAHGVAQRYRYSLEQASAFPQNVEDEPAPINFTVKISSPRDVSLSYPPHMVPSGAERLLESV